jgi:hypothetical protein
VPFFYAAGALQSGRVKVPLVLTAASLSCEKLLSKGPADGSDEARLVVENGEAKLISA